MDCHAFTSFGSQWQLFLLVIARHWKCRSNLFNSGLLHYIRTRCAPHSVCFSNGNSHNDDKNNFAILITRGFNPLRLFAIAYNGLPTGTQKRKSVVICKLELQKFNIKLVKTFLTSITFDSLSRKIKNPCLVINKFIIGGYSYEEYQNNFNRSIIVYALVFGKL